MTIAQAAGLNPVVCGLIMTIVVDSVILYPVQTASNLLGYESGYFNTADVGRFGIIMLELAMLVGRIRPPFKELRRRCRSFSELPLWRS